MEQELLLGASKSKVENNLQKTLIVPRTVSKRVSFIEPSTSEVRRREEIEMKELGASAGSIFTKRVTKVSRKNNELLPGGTVPKPSSTSSAWWQYLFYCCKNPPLDGVEGEGNHGAMSSSFPSTSVGLLSTVEKTDE